MSAAPRRRNQLTGLRRRNRPLLDQKYWTLLNDILREDDKKTKNHRVWLQPILNRIPTVPILAAVLTQLSHEPKLVSDALLQSVTRCYAVIWPLAIPKANQDAVVDCFWTWLSVQASAAACSRAALLDDIASMCCTQFSKAFASSPSKRKVCRRKCPFTSRSPVC